MPKNSPQKSTSSKSRNADRQNGKAWGHGHTSQTADLGHQLTGRTKPSGHSIGGHSLAKIRAKYGDSGFAADKVKASREHTHRADIRANRKAEAERIRRQRQAEGKDGTNLWKATAHRNRALASGEHKNG